MIFLFLFIAIIVVIVIVKIRIKKITFNKNYGNLILVIGGTGVGKTLFILNEGLTAYNSALKQWRRDNIKIWFNNWFLAPYCLKSYRKRPLLYSNFEIKDLKGRLISTPITKDMIIKLDPLVEGSIILISELGNWFNQDFYKDPLKDKVTIWFSQQRHFWNCQVFCDSQEEEMLYNGIRRSRSDLIYLLEGSNILFNRRIVLTDYTVRVFEKDEDNNVSKFIRLVPKKLFKMYDSRFNRDNLLALKNQHVKNSPEV